MASSARNDEDVSEMVVAYETSNGGTVVNVDRLFNTALVDDRSKSNTMDYVFDVLVIIAPEETITRQAR